MKINLNSEFKFTLTEQGAKVFNSQADSILGGVETKGGDEYTLHLWQIMQIFGSSTYNGMKVHFEGNRIELVQLR